ncbi:MAG: histidine kinase N-terminal 7TM domain-containing protein, partial [Candidatus Omnitrophota bacterium]
MNIFGISGILVFITSLLMAAFLILQKSREINNLLFASICICTAIWGFGVINIAIAQFPEVAFKYWQISFIGVILVPPIYFHFVTKFLNIINKKIILLIITSYLLAIFFLLINFLKKELFLGNMKLVFSQFYYFNSPGLIFFFFYILFYWILLGYSIYLLIRAYRYSKGTKNNQLKYFIIASLIGWSSAEGSYFTGFGFNIYPVSNLFMFLYPVIITLAIIKYR